MGARIVAVPVRYVVVTAAVLLQSWFCYVSPVVVPVVDAPSVATLVFCILFLAVLQLVRNLVFSSRYCSGRGGLVVIQGASAAPFQAFLLFVVLFIVCGSPASECVAVKAGVLILVFC